MRMTWGLFLPEAWVADPARRAEVGVPRETRYRTKRELVLGLFEGRSYVGWYQHVPSWASRMCSSRSIGSAAKNTSRWTLPQISQQLQRVLLQLGEWCPRRGYRLGYDTS